ncbi:hypothetical protein D3C81_2143640 [compost metagenome]
MLMSEQLACASHTGLHLIHDQQQPVLLAQRYNGIQEFLLYLQHAAFSQNHFQHNRCGALGDGSLQRCMIFRR